MKRLEILHLKRFPHLHEVRLPTSNEGLGIFPSVARPKAEPVDLFAKSSGIRTTKVKKKFWRPRRLPTMIKSDTFFYALKYAVKWPNFFFNIFALKIKKTLRPVPLISKYYSLDQKASGYASLKRFSHLHEVRLPTSNEGLGIFPSVARPKAKPVDLFAKISGIPVLGLFWPYFFFQSFCTKKWPNFFFSIFFHQKMT